MHLSIKSPIMYIICVLEIIPIIILSYEYQIKHTRILKYKFTSLNTYQLVELFHHIQLMFDEFQEHLNNFQMYDIK